MNERKREYICLLLDRCILCVDDLGALEMKKKTESNPNGKSNISWWWMSMKKNSFIFYVRMRFVINIYPFYMLLHTHVTWPWCNDIYIFSRKNIEAAAAELYPLLSSFLMYTFILSIFNAFNARERVYSIQMGQSTEYPGIYWNKKFKILIYRPDIPSRNCLEKRTVLLRLHEAR